MEENKNRVCVKAVIDIWKLEGGHWEIEEVVVVMFIVVVVVLIVVVVVLIVIEVLRK